MNADDAYEELLLAQSGSPAAMSSSLPAPLIVDPVDAVDKKPDLSPGQGPSVNSATLPRPEPPIAGVGPGGSDLQWFQRGYPQFKSDSVAGVGALGSAGLGYGAGIDKEEGSVARDILSGALSGLVRAGDDFNKTLAMIIGAPADITYSLLESFGYDVGDPAFGSGNIEESINSLNSWVVRNIPGLSDLDQDFTAFTREKASIAWVKTLAEGIARFGTGAVTGPVQAVRLLGVANPVVRGMAWGALTDFIQGSGSAKTDQTMLGTIPSMIEGLDALPKSGPERKEWADTVFNVFRKTENDPEIIRRVKHSLDGFVIGGAAEGVIFLAIKAVKAVPWGTLNASARQAVQQVKQLPVGLSTKDVGRPTIREMISKPATDLDPQGFYSAVSRAVDNLPMEKGGASQMRAMIAKGEGVKADEMSWIGLDDFLKGKKNVTKQEIRDFLDANQVEIREVVLGGETPDQLISQANSLMSQGQTLQATGDLEGARRLFDQHDELMRRAEGIELSSQGQLTPKYSEPNLNLPGGENYREVLLTLPNRSLPPELRGDAFAKAHGYELDKVLNVFTPESEHWQRAIREAGQGSDQRNFTAGHFDEDNVLAHIRLNDRTGPNGEKILFIEEIQSDWHQKGRKEGYRTPTGKLSAEKMEKFGGGVWEIRDQDGQFVTNITSPMSRVDNGELVEINIKSAEDAILMAQEQLDNPANYNLGAMKTRVPDAPFKKTWHEMSFRRVARMAAEEGYDAIAWTPGKIQAERYDLSKQLDTVRVEKLRGGTKDGQYYVTGEKDGQSVGLQEVVTEDKLADVIGKDLAEKVIKDAPKWPDGRDYSGLDLQVGGEGMKGFYDKMLKKYAEKWGKKFGSKVGTTQIGTKHSLRLVTDGRGNWKIYDPITESHWMDPDTTRIPTFTSREEAASAIKGAARGAEVWTLPITPKMRESVMKKGVPLFSAAGATAATAAAMQEERPAGGSY
tara:strand:- start:1404 stop:4295 length:2892 start_codon:yes stop_codon:yes gene_type:complete